MKNQLIQLAGENLYVFPQVVSILHESMDFDSHFIEKVAKSNSNLLFIVAKDLSSSDLHFPPYDLGTVVSIERIEGPHQSRKLYVKGKYRARRVSSSFSDPSLVSVEKLVSPEVPLQELKAAYAGLLDKFMAFCKVQNNLHAHELALGYWGIDMDKVHGMPTMTYLIHKLTQFSLYDFSFHPSENQHLLEVDHPVALAKEVEKTLDHLLLENIVEGYPCDEQEGKPKYPDPHHIKEEMNLMAILENVPLPYHAQNKSRPKAHPPKEERIPSRERILLAEILQHLDALNLPGKARGYVQEELDKLEILQETSNEYRETLSYLKIITKLPWSTQQEEAHLKEAETMLNTSHYGMDVVKKEMIRFMAERTLNKEAKGMVLCLVGPPGVGKTSLVRSMAKAMNREFLQLKLGGVSREAMIRGFERTYRSSAPGVIIKEMSRISSINPVMLLDEMDKISPHTHGDGDVASALLEVLDPSQNKEFQDHHLGIPYDLSQVFFVATANDVHKIPAPLRDRMEILFLEGYTRAQKFQILKDFLVEKKLQEPWLADRNIVIEDEVLLAIIDEHLAEPGIRSLERTLQKLFREVALRLLKEPVDALTITLENMQEFIDNASFQKKVSPKLRSPQVGRANTLKVQYGATGPRGAVGLLEVSQVPGHGHIKSTGNLGTVLHESVEVALSAIGLLAQSLGLPQNFREHHDFHIHFTEAGHKKDGSSAGVPLAMALASTLTGTPLRPDVAMTGEISLYGNIYAVGGVKAKIIGAYQAGMKKVLIPQSNEDVLAEIPPKILDALSIVPVGNILEAFDHVFLSPVLHEEAGPIIS